MKRTRLFRQVKHFTSAVPVNPVMQADSPSEKQKQIPTKTNSKLCFANLFPKNRGVTKTEAVKVAKGKKLRATVDLDSMKEELKQLEDPPLTKEEREISANRLPYPFFNVPCEDLAQNLLGKILVRRLENGTILKGRIVETEAYIGEIDKASQTYQGRVTPRNLPMYMKPGTIYVYLTYGMYHCFNISSAGKGCAILLRGIEPTEGIEQMRIHRTSKTKSKESKNVSKHLRNHELCNGPSKLCISFQIDRDQCKYSVCTCRRMWIEDDTESEDLKIVECSRIGIDSAGPEWANKPLRYYIYGNTSVSKRDKKAEAELISGM